MLFSLTRCLVSILNVFKCIWLKLPGMVIKVNKVSFSTDFTPKYYCRLGGISLNLFLAKQHLNMFKRWCEWGISQSRTTLSPSVKNLQYFPSRTVYVLLNAWTSRRQSARAPQACVGVPEISLSISGWINTWLRVTKIQEPFVLWRYYNFVLWKHIVIIQ